MKKLFSVLTGLVLLVIVGCSGHPWVLVTDGSPTESGVVFDGSPKNAVK